MPVTQKPQLNKIPIEEPTPILGRISWHIENTLVRFGKRVLNSSLETFTNIVTLALYKFLELIGPGIIDVSRPVLEDIVKMPGIPDNTKASISRALSGEHQGSSILTLLYSVVGFMGFITGAMSVTGRIAAHEVDSVMRSFRASPDILWVLSRLGGLDANEAIEQFKDLGVPDAVIQAYHEVSRNRLALDALGRAKLRGTIGEGVFDEELRKRGYSPDDMRVIDELLWAIPPAPDIIRMAVRDAWNPEAIERFGYREDWPEEFGQWAEKIGLKREWAERYWFAHWTLPSVQMGYEMLHRGIIDKNDLELLLRIQDIPRFWRDRLIAMSYRRVTRVDVRRMYRSGTYTEKDVYDAYLALGYNKKDAEDMTDWTIKEYQAEGRELTKSDILGALQDGVFTVAEATTYLSILDYSEPEIDALIARVLVKKQEQYEKEVEQNVRVAFVGFAIEEDRVWQELNKLNPPAGFVEERLGVWRIQRERGIKRLTVAQIRDFWLGDIITDDEAIVEMYKNKYTEEYTRWFMELWGKKRE